jgi:hypothetical protein
MPLLWLSFSFELLGYHLGSDILAFRLTGKHDQYWALRKAKRHTIQFALGEND